MDNQFLKVAGLVLLSGLSAFAQTPSPTTRQIGPGGTGSISNTVSVPATEKQQTLLDSALTPKTRKTLQKAMDSTPAK